MSNFLKHVGKHGDRRTVILFREVPNEGHMCLVIYPDVLPAPWEDAIMRALESDMGQQAEEFANALHRTLLPDGRAVLETLHRENMIKKVRTADIIVTPRSDSRIKLDELNKMLNEMKQGEDAVKRMAELDKSRGLQDPVDVARRVRENKTRDAKVPATQPLIASSSDALGDNAIANNLRQQAQKMEAEAKGLLAESARLMSEAASMDPVKPVAKKTTKAKKTKVSA